MFGRNKKIGGLLQVSGIALAVGGITYGQSAIAEIQVNPRISVTQTWTDQANLDNVNAGGNGDFITTVAPGFQLTGNGRRVNAFIDYTLNGLVFWQQSENSDIRHNLQAAVDTEIIRDHFFVDVRANVNQFFRNFAGPIAGPQQNFTENRATLQNYAVTPRWRQNIGNFAVADVSYSMSYIDQGQELTFGPGLATSNSLGHTGQFVLRNGTKFNRLTWTWNNRYQYINRGLRDLNFESYESILDGAYNVSRKLAVLGSVGYENIRDDTLANIQRGVVWDVGARLRPGPRLELVGRVGRRFDDTVFSGSVSYQFSDRDQLTGSYSEDLTVANRNFLNSAQGLQIDSNGDGFPDIPTVVDPLIGQPAFLNDGAFRQKQGNVTLSRTLRRTQLNATAFWLQQEFSPTLSNESYGVSFGGNYRITGTHSVGGQAIFRRSEFFQGTDDFLTVSPTYTFTVSPNFNAQAQYSYSRRFGAGQIPSFTANTVSISLNALF